MRIRRIKLKLLGCQQQGYGCATRNSLKFLLLVARRHLLREVCWQLRSLVVPIQTLKQQKQACRYYKPESTDFGADQL